MTATVIPPYDDLRPLPTSALVGGGNGELTPARQVSGDFGVVFQRRRQLVPSGGSLLAGESPVLTFHLFSAVGARVLDAHDLIYNPVANSRFLNLDSRFITYARGGKSVLEA
jgi:hypothetical protein